MRALFVVNPHATTATIVERDILEGALGDTLELDVVPTTHRGHATEIGKTAAARGADLVIAHGGDGTVNELVNGLLAVPAGDRPHLAVLPGGHANVFSRALGQPTDPVAAARLLAASVQQHRRRVIGLGEVNGRFFTFSAGLGFDASVVQHVDLRRAAGHAATTPQYARSALKQYLQTSPWRHPGLTVTTPAGLIAPKLHVVIVANTDPWTYVGDQPLHACPEASFETGLDIVALRRLSPATLATTFAQFATARPRSRHMLRLHDLGELTVHARTPVPLQVDGEYAGNVTRATLRSHPDALTVVPAVAG